MRHLTSLVVLSFAVFAAGCSATVTDGSASDGDDGGCGPMPPDDHCHPTWECMGGEWIDTSTDVCPPQPCPELKPADGDACSRVGQSCVYSEDVPCGPYEEVTSTCTTDGWITYYARCQPEPTCPDVMPEVGTYCGDWDYAYYCQYEASCGGAPQYLSFSCDYGTESPSWTSDGEVFCYDCRSVGDSAACGAFAGCRWLTPGCGDPSTPALPEGCYPESDCLVDGCPEDPGQVCVTYTYDPCANLDCDACGASVGVCELSRGPQ